MIAIEKQRALAHANDNLKPEWVRITGAIKVCGLQKTRLYELLNEASGKIRTLVLKSPGAQRGARLIHLPTLLGYLEGLSNEQRAK
jgi:hypothetical protein